jgi:hypothetical protein
MLKSNVYEMHEIISIFYNKLNIYPQFTKG